MPYTVTGSPLGAFGDAVLDALLADATLSVLVGGRIYAVLKTTVRTARPYIVGGRRDLNQEDMIHPTAAGHRIVADLVWRMLEPILRTG